MAKKKTAKKANAKKTIVQQVSLASSINTEVIAAALSSANVPVLLKVCRLCESKDGPFLNIFDANKITARKIETVMPFVIEENDELPHKICFRCSAKLEELYEFIQKCTKTQENLRKALGNRGIGVKTKHRQLWEEKLNQSNISNDDICDALIKKAMEGIKDIPLNSLPIVEDKASLVKKVTKKVPTKKKEEVKAEKEDNLEEGKTKTSLIAPKDDDDDDDESIMALKNAKEKDNDKEEIPVKRSTRLSLEKKVELSENKPSISDDKKVSLKQNKKDHEAKVTEEAVPVTKEISLKIRQSLQTNNFSLQETSNIESPKAEPDPKPFDIMDHVSMIKVNGVGVLFQCKVCNRNFLKKEVVLSHACAKHGSAKVQSQKAFIPTAPPKIPQTVKYITMNVNKEISKPVVLKDKTENPAPTSSEPINLDDKDDDKPITAKMRPKPKIGPASKVKRSETNTIPVASGLSAQFNTDQNVSTQIAVLPVNATISSANQIASVQFPTIPSLNSRYKLMPGPNNTFTLVEDKNNQNVVKTVESQVTVPFTLTECNKTDVKIHKTNDIPIENSTPLVKQSTPSANRPYPVGLIQSITASGSRALPLNTEPPVAFPTPAIKKQSYTVVQTGNPSKLLISTKPQPPQPEEEVPKKRPRKLRNVVKENESNKQPFSVTIEDAAPTIDPRIFTFINVDPLLQPSYVLPTNNIIQESQISTSTNVLKHSEDKDNKYTCNMCNEKFSREKKLLAHIQLHYTKMDEEDSLRAKNPKKRSRK